MRETFFHPSFLTSGSSELELEESTWKEEDEYFTVDFEEGEIDPILDGRISGGRKDEEGN